MSYQLKIGPRQRKAGRFIGAVRDAFLRAIQEERKAGNKVTQQSIAKKLELDRSVVNRWLAGEANLTLRSVADLAWSLDREIVFKLQDHSVDTRSNFLILAPVVRSEISRRETRMINSQPEAQVIRE